MWAATACSVFADAPLHLVSQLQHGAAGLRYQLIRLGYDNARTWRNLLLTHRNDIAAAMNIPPNEFRWYAAFALALVGASR